MAENAEKMNAMNQETPNQALQTPHQDVLSLARAKREFERCLRAAGFSHSQAKRLVHEQFSPSSTDQKTSAAEKQPQKTAHQGDYLLARAKRELERRLREDGYTQSEALREVSAQFPPKMKGSSK